MFVRRNDAMNVYNPFRMMDELERQFFSEPVRTPRGSLGAFRTDLKDEGSEYVLDADLPGFEKKDIHLDLQGDVLTIRAERHSEHEDKDKRGKYISCERTYGSYRRSFDMSGVNTDDIRARYENGVLTLNLPKKQDALSETRTLDIE